MRRGCTCLRVYAGCFIAILVFAYIYVRASDRRWGARRGASLGLLFGIFMAGAFVAVNYATINISGKLALELAISEVWLPTLDSLRTFAAGCPAGMLPGLLAAVSSQTGVQA